MSEISDFRSTGPAAEGPAARYQALVDAGRLKFDDRQVNVAGALQQCHDALLKYSGGWFRRPRAVKGVYIHGGVGRGKTLLMDLFVQSLEAAGVSVERAHFHRFMDDVHAGLKQIGKRSSPLTEIAAGLRKRARVLCFDEFHVEDIADAMLLGELSTQLFQRGITLVTTSNQRDPALEQLGRKLAQQHCVGNIFDVELVETQHPRPLSQAGRDFGQGAAAFSDLLQPGVDIVHEAMKMRALDAYACSLQRLHEKIHQQRLAAPDAAVDVDPLDGTRPPEPAA